MISIESYEESWEDDLLVEPVAPDPVSSHDFARLGETYPDIKNDVDLLLFIYSGGTHPAPPLKSTYLGYRTNFSGLLERHDSSASNDEVFTTFCGFIRQARHRQGLKSFSNLLADLASPELHGVLGILNTDIISNQQPVIDEFGLRVAELALRRNIAERNGLTETEMESGRHHGVRRQYQAALQWLHENPPVKRGPQKDESDFFKDRCVEAVRYLSPKITELINAGGYGDLAYESSGDRVTINSNVRHINVDGWYIDEEDDVYQLPGIGVEIVFDDGRSEWADLGSILDIIGENYKSGQTLSPVNILNLAIVDSLTWSEDFDEFKKAVAFNFHTLRSGVELIDHPDSSLFQYSPSDLMLEHLILNGAEVVATEVARYNFDRDDKNIPDEDWLNIHNSSERTGGYRGQVKSDEIAEITRQDRMIVHSGEYVSLTASIAKPETYDAELEMTLPLSPDSPKAELLDMPGYSIAGFQLNPNYEEGQLVYQIQYRKLDHDPYVIPDIDIDRQRLMAFAAKLGSIGLDACGDDLVALDQPTLQAILDTFSRHSHYGTGQRLIQARVARVEHLEPFVECEQLIGTCTVFAAMAKFAIDDLLPGSQAIDISGYRIRRGGKVAYDGHAQAAFLHNGMVHITEYGGYAARKSPLPEFKKAVAEIDLIRVLEPNEQLLCTVQNLKSGLGTLLCNKYDIDARSQKRLLETLAKKRPEHFGRRLYGLYMRLESILSSGDEDFSKSLKEASETSNVLEAWAQRMSSNGMVSRQLNDIYDTWSISEIEILRYGLKQLEGSLTAFQAIRS